MIDLSIVGIPRSGNVFLSYALSEMYDVERQNRPIHSERALKTINYIVLPIRNPEQCILSTMNISSNQYNEDMINFLVKRYNTFMKQVVRYRYKMSILNFDIFINDLDYVAKKLNKKFNYPLDLKIKNNTQEIIKNKMLINDKIINLPRKYTIDVEKVKSIINKSYKIEECITSYKKVLEYSHV